MPVTNGLFVLSLEYSAGVLNREARWLQLYVRTNHAPNYTVLAPRQPITPTPYALFSGCCSRES